MTELTRRLGLRDAVVLGMGSMLGAGVFVVYSPAAASAGSWLLVALAVAAVIAYCNATSSARLASVYPVSGGTYVYGRERLGPFWGHLAGWAFVVGKSASCAAMALTVGTYLWPSASVPVAVVAVAALTALSYRGIHRGTAVTRVIVGIVLAGLLLFVVALWFVPPETLPAVEAPATGDVGVRGVLQAAGFFFFAFAGYARIATLGEEVVDPERTIPRAIPLALGAVLAVYALVGVTFLATLGSDWLGSRAAPIAEAAGITGWPWTGPVLRIVAAVAALGALLGLLLGVSRTVLAMARDRHFSRALTAVHPTHGVPHRAQVVVGLVVAALVIATDLRGAIGFASFCVLVYYAIANASAWTLDTSVRSRAIPALGFLGCLLVAAMLPLGAVVAGCVVLAIGAGVWALTRAARRGHERRGETMDG